MRFRNVFYGLVPSWLSSGDGERVLYSLGLMQDAMAERYRLSYEADLPEYAPEDALAYIGRDRQIRRGVNEPLAAYAARLIRFLDDHRTQGNPFAMLDQLYAFLQKPSVILRTVDRRGNWFSRSADGTRSYALALANWDWDGGALTRWGRYWVIIEGAWDTQWDPTVLGSDSGTTEATREEILGTLSLIREWKPAGVRAEWVIIAAAGTFGPSTGDDPGGDWGTWADGSGMNWRPVRRTDARYWKV